MNSAMIALGLASIMICLGMVLRAKVPFLRKMLVPVSVVGGVIGFIFMNVVTSALSTDLGGADADMFTEIVNVLFTISFISIGLTDARKKKKIPSVDGKKESGVMKGALGMGMVWCALYTLTPVIGYVLISIIGKPFGMSGEYGMLIPFAFCQGPGQAATYGLIFEETYGFLNSSQVAIMFAVVGFLVAFLVGVPIAKIGMKKKIARYAGKLNRSVEKGIFTPEEQREPMGKVTTHSGSIDTLAFHFALIGVCYMVAIGISKLVSFIPIFGPTFANMMFFCGMLAAYLVKAVMKKLHINYIKNDVLQSKITGWTSDFLVVCAFMAVKLEAVGNWLTPILIECVVVTVITAVACLYYGERFGGENDFERVLGLYGTCTGTTPSGVALVRMADPKLVTPTAVELGMMNITMFLSTPGMILLTLGMTGVMSIQVCCIGMTITGVIFLLLLKPMHLCNKPTFTLAKGRISKGSDDDDLGFVQGFLREEGDSVNISSMIE